MMDIERPVLEQAMRETGARGFLSAMGGPQFLVAQFFTIVATILGVYLAGYVGFQRTLEYDRYIKAQQQSDVLQAMHEELKQNAVRLRKFDERLPADSGTGVVSTEWPHLRLFIWQAAGRTASAFDMPPQTLADMQAFYEDIGEMLNENEAHDSFAHLSMSNTYYRKQFKERLNAELKLAQTSILPALEKASAASEQLVSKYSDAKGGSR